MQLAVLITFVAGLFGAASAKPVTAAGSSSPGYSTRPTYPICKSKAPFATVDKHHPRLFDFNGTSRGPRYFAGTNTWWLSHILNDSDVNRVLSEIKGVSHLYMPIQGTSSY